MRDEPIDSKGTITVRSMYGHANRRPLVSLRVRDVAAMIPPEAAIEVGRNLIEAAEAARCDAAVFEMATEGMGLDEEDGARFLSLFRKYREGQGR